MGGVHRDEVAHLCAPDVRVRIVQPSPWIVRGGLDLRWRRLAQRNVSHQPHMIPCSERGCDLVAHWLRGIFQDHLRFKQIVTMEPMIREWWNCGPRRRTRILTIERNTKRPWMDDDQVVWPRALAQDAGSEIHVRLTIGDKLMRAWHASERENRKRAAPGLPARERGVDANCGKSREWQKVPGLRRHFRNPQEN